jgi:hypothetical protein
MQAWYNGVEQEVKHICTLDTIELSKWQALYKSGTMGFEQ